MDFLNFIAYNALLDPWTLAQKDPPFDFEYVLIVITAICSIIMTLVLRHIFIHRKKIHVFIWKKISPIAQMSPDEKSFKEDELISGGQTNKEQKNEGIELVSLQIFELREELTNIEKPIEELIGGLCKLFTKCQKLQTEIAANKSKLTAAIKTSEEDKVVIGALKIELLKTRNAIEELKKQSNSRTTQESFHEAQQENKEENCKDDKFVGKGDKYKDSYDLSEEIERGKLQIFQLEEELSNKEKHIKELISALYKRSTKCQEHQKEIAANESKLIAAMKTSEEDKVVIEALKSELLKARNAIEESKKQSNSRTTQESFDDAQQETEEKICKADKFVTEENTNTSYDLYALLERAELKILELQEKSITEDKQIKVLHDGIMNGIEFTGDIQRYSAMKTSEEDKVVIEAVKSELLKAKNSSEELKKQSNSHTTQQSFDDTQQETKEKICNVGKLVGRGDTNTRYNLNESLDQEELQILEFQEKSINEDKLIGEHCDEIVGWSVIEFAEEQCAVAENGKGNF